MEAVFWKVVNMSITASWLVLAIAAVRLAFRKIPKWMLCLLWGLVALRLICPFSIESTVSLVPSTEVVHREQIYSMEPGIPKARGDILDSRGNVVKTVTPPAAREEPLDSSGEVVQEANNEPLPADPADSGRNWSRILPGIWVTGIAVMLSYTLLSYLFLKRKVAAAIPVEKGIKQSEYIDSPFVLGIFRPVIYLPFGVEEADLSYVIAHERSHIRRRDHWWKPIGFVLLSIHWFNPVLWLAYVLLCRDIEAACDEKVIQSLDMDGRRAYSTALLNCSIHRRAIAACPLAFGETGVKARVKQVMHYKKPAFWVVLTAVVLCIFIAVCFLTDPVSEEEMVPAAEAGEETDIGVITWFDRYTRGAELESAHMELPGADRGLLVYDKRTGTLEIHEGGTKREVFTDLEVQSLFLHDLSGDGVADILATVQQEDFFEAVHFYDVITGGKAVLSGGGDLRYRLVKLEDHLFLQELDSNWNIVGYGQPRLWNDALVMDFLAPEFQHLTETVRCIDINNRKLLCLSDEEDIEAIFTILKTMAESWQPLPPEQLEAIQAEALWDATVLEINYVLGQEVLYFSEDCSVCWMGTEGYAVSDPEPLRQYVERVTDGVINRTASGEPFATMDAPWDWCGKVSSGAVELARMEVTTYVGPGSASGSGGIISQDTLEEFASLVKQIPRSAFSPGQKLGKDNFWGFINGPHALSSGIALVDGVNELVVGFLYCNDTVQMVLTDQMEQADRGNYDALTSYRIWNVDDGPLMAFLKRTIEAPPVITYSVGAEYEWQPPLFVGSGDFEMELRLIEDWEYEMVEQPDSTGIRCRPQAVEEGWIYFSFWPEGYHPEESDRYINEGFWYGYPSYTSYPADVKTPTSFSTYKRIWSYQRMETEIGDYAIINEGADDWFLTYQDQLEDTITLVMYGVHS